MPRLERGLVQIYTGKGKGKTTAALGLALRAIGQGLQVCVIQFMKGSQEVGEAKAAQRLQPHLQFASFGVDRWKGPEPKDSDLPWWQQKLSQADKEAAEQGLKFAQEIIAKGKYDLVILDEITHALRRKLIPLKTVQDLIRTKPPWVELILTGRNAPEQLIEMADLVTEMKEVKHPYRQSMPARKGIEF